MAGTATVESVKRALDKLQRDVKAAAEAQRDAVVRSSKFHLGAVLLHWMKLSERMVESFQDHEDFKATVVKPEPLAALQASVNEASDLFVRNIAELKREAERSADAKEALHIPAELNLSIGALDFLDENTSRLLALEDTLHIQFSEVLHSGGDTEVYLKTQAQVHHLNQQQNPGTESKCWMYRSPMMQEGRRLWIRTAGFSDNRQHVVQFADIVRLSLQLEYPQCGFEEALFPKVLVNVLTLYCKDKDNPRLTAGKWDEVVMCMGPAKEFFRKMSAVTDPSTGELLPWYTNTDRGASENKLRQERQLWLVMASSRDPPKYRYHSGWDAKRTGEGDMHTTLLDGVTKALQGQVSPSMQAALRPSITELQGLREQWKVRVETARLLSSKMRHRKAFVELASDRLLNVPVLQTETGGLDEESAKEEVREKLGAGAAAFQEWWQRLSPKQHRKEHHRTGSLHRQVSLSGEDSTRINVLPEFKQGDLPLLHVLIRKAATDDSGQWLKVLEEFLSDDSVLTDHPDVLYRLLCSQGPPKDDGVAQGATRLASNDVNALVYPCQLVIRMASDMQLEAKETMSGGKRDYMTPAVKRLVGYPGLSVLTLLLSSMYYCAKGKQEATGKTVHASDQMEENLDVRILEAYKEAVVLFVVTVPRPRGIDNPGDGVLLKSPLVVPQPVAALGRAVSGASSIADDEKHEDTDEDEVHEDEDEEDKGQYESSGRVMAARHRLSRDILRTILVRHEVKTDKDAVVKLWHRAVTHIGDNGTRTSFFNVGEQLRMHAMDFIASLCAEEVVREPIGAGGDFGALDSDGPTKAIPTENVRRWVRRYTTETYEALFDLDASADDAQEGGYEEHLLIRALTKAVDMVMHCFFPGKAPARRPSLKRTVTGYVADFGAGGGSAGSKSLTAELELKKEEMALYADGDAMAAAFAKGMNKQSELHRRKGTPLLSVVTQCRNKNPYSLLHNLLQWGASVERTDDRDRNLLHHIAGHADMLDVEQVASLLRQQEEASLHTAVNAVDQENETPVSILFKANQREQQLGFGDNSDKYIQLVFLFVMNGASITELLKGLEVREDFFGSALRNFLERRENEWGRWYLLEAAVRNGDKDLVSMLLNPQTMASTLPYMFRPFLQFDAPAWVLEIQGLSHDTLDSLLALCDDKELLDIEDHLLKAELHQHIKLKDPERMQRLASSQAAHRPSTAEEAKAGRFSNTPMLGGVVNVSPGSAPPDLQRLPSHSQKYERKVAFQRAERSLYRRVAAWKYERMYGRRSQEMLATFHKHETQYSSGSILRVAVEAENKSPEIIKMLLEHNPTARDVSRALSSAGSSAKISETLLKSLFELNKFDPLLAKRSEWAQNVASVKLFEHVQRWCMGANLSHVDREGGRTVLHISCMSELPSPVHDQINTMLINRASTRDTDRLGYVALHYAAHAGRLHTVDTLIAAHSALDTVSGGELQGPSPVARDMVSANMWLTVRKLAEERSDPFVFYSDFADLAMDDSDEQAHMQSFNQGLGRTALHIAALNGHWQVCASLTEANPGLVNALDEDGWTPLSLSLYVLKKLEEIKAALNEAMAAAGESEFGISRLEQAQALHHPQVASRASVSLLSPSRVQKEAAAVPVTKRVKVTVVHELLFRALYDKKHSHDSLLPTCRLPELTARIRRLAELEDVLDDFEKRNKTSLDAYWAAINDMSESERDEQLRKALEEAYGSSDDEPDQELGADGHLHNIDTSKNRVAPHIRMARARNRILLLMNRKSDQNDPAVAVSYKCRIWNERRTLTSEGVLDRWLEDYRGTTEVLFGKGADIRQATTSFRKNVDHLLHVEGEMQTIKSNVEGIENKLHQHSNSPETQELYRNQRKEIFEKTVNQIVIDQYYNRHVRPRQIKTLLSYSLFLILLTLLGIYETTRDDTSAHFLHASMVQTIADDEYDSTVSPLKRTFLEIDDKGEFWQWTRGVVLDVFYPSDDAIPTYWSGSTSIPRTAGSGQAGGYIQVQNRLIGLPRLRQVRSRAAACDVPSDFQTWNGACMSRVSIEEDEEPFGPSLQYRFQSEEQLGGIYIVGRNGVYQGGGYVENLPTPYNTTSSRDAALAKFEELEKNNWIDPKTRAVFFEFSVFNANHQFFLNAVVMVEFPRSGGSIPSYSFTVGKFKRYMNSNDIWAGFLEVAVLLYFFFDLLVLLWVTFDVRWSCCYDEDQGRHVPEQVAPAASAAAAGGVSPEDIRLNLQERDSEDVHVLSTTGQTTRMQQSAGRGCCHIVYNPPYMGFTFIMYIVMNMIMIGVVVLHVWTLLLERDVDWHTDSAYVQLTRIAHLNSIETGLLSVTVFVAWIRLVDYLVVWKTFSRLMIMLAMMVRKLFQLFWLYVVFMCMFASAEYVAYGYMLPNSYTWFFGFFTRLSQSFSGRPIDTFTTQNRILGTFYSLSFVVVVSLLMLNLIIAMMTSAYQDALEESGEIFWAETQYASIIEYSNKLPRQGKLTKYWDLFWHWFASRLVILADKLQLFQCWRRCRPGLINCFTCRWCPRPAKHSYVPLHAQD